MSLTDFDAAVQRWTIVAAITFFFLFFVSAPYGRFHSKKWGPTLDGKIGWCVQECASPIALSYFYFFADAAPFHFPKGTKPLGNGGDEIVLCWFVVHYLHRAIVWPMRRTLGKTNLPVVSSAVLFNVFNGAFVASELRAMGGIRRSQDDAMFKFGLVVAAIGALINFVSDEMLLRQRRANTRATPTRAAARRHSAVSTNKSKYILPSGFLFDYCLCPNYLGEFIEWLGLAVATNNVALKAFAFWTFANLFPRSVKYRKWYADAFGEKAVGTRRKAFFPFLV